MTRALSHRFTVTDVHRMVESGMFHEDDRVELLNGEVVDMPPPGPLHSEVIDRLIAVFSKLVPRQARMRVQDPVQLSDISQPQPDIVLIRPRAEGYADRHPGPKDIHLLVEVGDSSIRFDLEAKIPLYALAGVAEVWLVDVQRQMFVVHRKPRKDGYQQTPEFGIGDKVSPLAFPKLKVAVADILA
ncbi:MAG: Uma2 family endonuclease [Phycisphaeraceae bacterium]